MGDVKQANFRINEDTAAQFRTFCEENNFTQAQGFDHMMQVMELNKAKAMLPARETEISEFERLVKSLLSAYLNSLELANTTEIRVLEEFRSQLESKDKQIIELQERNHTLLREVEQSKTDCCVLSQQVEGYEEKISAFIRERDTAVAQVTQIEASSQKSLLDKDIIIHNLNQTIEQAEERLHDLEQYQKENKTLRKEKEGFERIIREQELKYAADIRELEQSHQVALKEQLLVTEQRHTASINDKNTELIEMMKRHQDNVNTLTGKCETLMKENVELKMQIETLAHENTSLKNRLEREG